MSATARRAWALNFDAGDELARGAGHNAPRKVRARAHDLVLRVGGLVPPGDVVVVPAPIDGSRPDATGLVGLAWCPTPGAIAALRASGAVPAASPPLDVLRRVTHRRFAFDLGVDLEGARWVSEAASIEAAIAGESSPTGRWLLKRPFGYAGRGRLVVGASLGPADRAWIASSLRAGEGLALEPFVELRGDFAQHGFIAQGGAVVVGAPTRQRCDERGAWIATEPLGAGDLDRDERARLEASTRESGAALARAGYFGPFGVDAFRFVDAGGALRFRSRCEINPRYSMGWATGMGASRPDLVGVI